MENLPFFFYIIALPAPLFLILALLYIYQWYRKRKGLRSPLTRQLLRPPGESLRVRVEEINIALNEAFFVVALVPLFMSIVIFSSTFVSGRGSVTYSLIVIAFIWMCFISYYIRKIFKLLSERRALRLGLDGEMAVAEELNKLMLDGYHVYHDFPAEKFNIDHIIVGSVGIFAVETKTRSKKNADRGKSMVEVTYDGNRLSFPDGYNLDVVTQAKDQGTWLEKWLTSAVGERVGVGPIVTLPGWYVKRTKPDGIPVLNPKEIRGYIISKKKIISEVMIKRIVHQVDQRCRNVEPKEG